jgi:hypothetical protein
MNKVWLAVIATAFISIPLLLTDPAQATAPASSLLAGLKAASPIEAAACVRRRVCGPNGCVWRRACRRVW